MYSNTSHVIVYRLFAPSPLRPSQIQIHLMLLFIVLNSVDSTLAEYSNTSHVIVYPGWIYYKPAGRIIQIHLMLLFIIAIVPLLPGLPVFKYISCYCLSLLPSLLHSPPQDSNTSHVIVYLVEGRNQEAYVEFKYISCYCLSGGSGKLCR